MAKFGFIGCGHMGSVLAKIAASDKKTQVCVSDASAERAEAFAKQYGAKSSTNLQIASDCDYVVICVRPQDLATLCSEIAPVLGARNDVTVISIAVGVAIEKIRALLGLKDTPVIRVMPNTPLSVGKGVILYTAENVCSESESVFKKTFGSAGKLYAIPEELMDAGGCISGCGPAFVYRFIDSFAKAGEKCGLPGHLAFSLALKTIEGAVRMAEAGNFTPSELCAQVCSKGGTTERGVSVIDEADLDKIMSDAVEASLKRTLELKQ